MQLELTHYEDIKIMASGLRLFASCGSTIIALSWYIHYENMTLKITLKSLTTLKNHWNHIEKFYKR